MEYNKFKLIFIFLVIFIFCCINLTPLTYGNNKKSNYLPNNIKFYNSYISNNALFAYWSLDEGSGTIAYDHSGHNLNGIIHGATWTSGYSGYALSFDGALDYILLDDYSEELGMNKTDDYKISTWIKTEADSSGVIYMLSDLWSAIPIFYIKLMENGSIEMRISSSESCDVTVDSETSYNDGLWHFIEGIYHGSDTYPSMDLYVDNELVASKTDWLCPLESNQFKKVKIGMASYDTLYMYEGIIDEIKVYKRPEGNIPPSPPNISGEVSGTVGEEYIYTFIPTDPEGDEMYLWIDWGDNTNTSWIGPYSSGEEIELNHAWSEYGLFEIKAKTRDIFDVGEPSIFLVAMGNIAPDKPIITGPTSGNKGELIEYNFVATDLNDHNVKYYIDWGDGNTEWTDYYSSSEKVSKQHSWSEPGIYSITSKSKDNLETESELSDPFTLTITEKTFIIGLISNLSSDDEFITLNAKLLIYTSLNPSNTKFLLSEEILLISSNYKGKITVKFIFGLFNSYIL